MNAVSGRSVLIVDDNELIRDALVDFFSFNGYEAFTAGNGAEALTLLKKKSFSIMITDFKMPKMNGIELTKSVRKLKIPVIIIGMSADDHEELFLVAGSDYFLLKPIDFKLLKSLLNSIR